ncbi:hypothetical protein [Pectinatus brassicae]|uniref:hypothetical protein n=1 Tax=Pectinatus brassicae TaxID=862415 RepID=UPI002889A9C3|nr:hypothetical protein [Pectinatus brassicae]
MKKEKLWTLEFIVMSCSNFFQYISQYIMVAALPIYIMNNLGGRRGGNRLGNDFFSDWNSLLPTFGWTLD